MAQDVHAPRGETLSLLAQLQLAAAARTTQRTATRSKAPSRAALINDRREALQARKAFRDATAILKAELV